MVYGNLLNEKERIISKTKYRVDDEIRAPQVRLIGPDGENHGIVDTSKALRIAHDAELELVEVAPDGNPPVCRVMNYGKFLYERTKKEREARKSQVKVEIKEIRLRPKTNEHHRTFKIRNARRWLENGIKVKVSIRFRGREITYPELALEDLKEIAAELSDVSTVDLSPNIEGRVMTMMLNPTHIGRKKKSTTPKKQEKKRRSSSDNSSKN